jgi:alpha-mannosidase
MGTHLTVEQRLDWLEVRIGELELWIVREWVALGDWTFDGAPLPLGAPWPARDGVHRVAHPRLVAPWPDARLELDLGGEGLVTLRYADGGMPDRFGLDAEHRTFAPRSAPFEIDVDAVARLPFGAPNRDARLAHARLTRIEPDLERLVRRLRLVLEAGRELRAHALVDAAARALAALSQVAAEHPEIAEIEVNPLLVRPRSAVGLDARVVLAGAVEAAA